MRLGRIKELAAAVTGKPDSPGRPPSLDIVRREVELEVASQERRGASLDTKAGLILGFAGVVAGFAKDLPTGWLPSSLIFAVLAAGAAVRALVPRIAGSVNPRSLRDRYLTATEDETAQVLLDTRIVLYERDERRLKDKLRWMRIAVVFLFLAIVLVSAGYIQRSGYGTAKAPTPGRTASPHARVTR